MGDCSLDSPVSASTNRDVGGGPSSGEPVVSAASRHKARISSRLTDVWLAREQWEIELPSTYSIVRLGYDLFSWMGGSRPSCKARSSASLADSQGRFWGGLQRTRTVWELEVLRRLGLACRFLGGLLPSSPSTLIQSRSWASSFARMSSAWSATLRASLSSTSFSKSITRPKSSSFSDSS